MKAPRDPMLFVLERLRGFTEGLSCDYFVGMLREHGDALPADVRNALERAAASVSDRRDAVLAAQSERSTQLTRTASKRPSKSA